MHVRSIAIAAALTAPLSAGTGDLLIHQGLSWFAIGDALVSIEADHLVVSNIGSSGRDGVQVPLGYAQGMLVCMTPRSMPPGAFIEARRTFVDGDGNVVASATTRVEALSGASRYAASFGGRGGHDVEVLLQGQSVARLLDHPFGWDAQAPTVPTHHFRWVDRNVWVVEYRDPLAILLPDGQIATGDEIRIGPAGGDVIVDVKETIDVVAAGTDTLTFCDAALLDFDLIEVRGLGQARFTRLPDRLLVGNIGSSGEDGSTVSRGTPLRAIHNESVGFYIPGSTVCFASRFVVDGTVHAREMSARMAADSNFYRVFGDFLAAGATTMTAEVWLGGQVIHAVSGLPFDVTAMETEALPDCDVWDFLGSGVAPDVQLRLIWADPVLTRFDGQEFLVDAVVLRPDDGDPIDALHSSSRRAANLPEFEILDVIIAELSCPGDVDADGIVGVSDLLQVLANWGPCPGCLGDLDGSGDVDITDMLMVLANWGRCP